MSPGVARRPRRAPAAWAALASLILAIAVGAGPGRANGLLTTLSAQVQANIGLKTTTLSSQKRSAQVDAFAKVLDPGPLAQLESDLLAAQASATASRAEAQRARSLNATGGSVAKKDLEAAVAQAGNDDAHLALLKRRLGLEWGPGIARLPDAQRKALIDELARGSAALVHVDTPNNEGQDGARSVDIDVGSASAHGVVLGAARQAEPRLQSSGLIVKVSGPSAILLSIGLTQSAHINQSSALAGVVLPRSAVIRFEGSDWAYVRRGPTSFERRLIPSPVPQEKGLFAAKGFGPGEEVVSQGAAEIFAIERAQVTRPH
jgi:hypothetical protein